MTYFGFLLQFLALPLAILLFITLRDGRQGKIAPGFLNRQAVWLAIGLQVLLAVIYTTPWDNYLVATGVWFYDPKLISGVILGWVPLEEYTFFVLEAVLTGLWWWVLARRLEFPGGFKPGRNIRILSTTILGAMWLLVMCTIAFNWKPGTYFSLIFAWALPAIILQLVFGADVLWHYRRLLIWTIAPVFIYISAADSLAISSGTWTIDPSQSMGIFIGSLPVEEAVFFLTTATLISFGLTLSLARASQARWFNWVNQMPGTAKITKENAIDSRNTEHYNPFNPTRDIGIDD